MPSRKRTPVSINIRIRRTDGGKITRAEAESVFRELMDTQRLRAGFTLHAIDWAKGGKEYHYEGDELNHALQVAFPLIERGTPLRIDAPDDFS